MSAIVGFWVKVNNRHTWELGLMKAGVIDWKWKDEHPHWGGVRFAFGGVSILRKIWARWRSPSFLGILANWQVKILLPFDGIQLNYSIRSVPSAFSGNDFIPPASTSWIQNLSQCLVTEEWHILLPLANLVVENVHSKRKVTLLLYVKTGFFIDSWVPSENGRGQHEE